MSITIDAKHFAQSSFRENIIEHLFVGELLRWFWKNDEIVDVLRADVDSGGYDLVLEWKSVVRHVQLKASKEKAKTREQKVNVALESKPSGCVVWIKFDEESLALKSFFWFGGQPGSPVKLGDKVARHTKANSKGEKLPRKDIRVLAATKFTRVDSITDLVHLLFGMPSLSR